MLKTQQYAHARTLRMLRFDHAKCQRSAWVEQYFQKGGKVVNDVKVEFSSIFVHNMSRGHHGGVRSRSKGHLRSNLKNVQKVDLRSF